MLEDLRKAREANEAALREREKQTRLLKESLGLRREQLERERAAAR